MKTLAYILILLNSFIAQAEQRVGGTLTRDTRWTADNNPYIIEKDLLIPRYIRLSISSGVKVIAATIPLQDTAIHQIDNIDEFTVSIKVQGVLQCQGKADRRVTFVPQELNRNGYGWYGIIFDNAEKDGNEITNSDITGAYTALTVKESEPLIHRLIIERNHIGVFFTGSKKAALSNSVITNNLLTGIRVIDANPSIYNSIITGNMNNGLWCDGNSRVDLGYNCFFNNADGNFVECDPEFGVLTKKNNRGDSCDIAFNIFADPIFAGSPADSLAAERDLKVPTDKANVKNTLMADIINTIIPPPPVKETKTVSNSRYALSKYSPCLSAGNPSEQFKNIDGSRNDIGITGGQDFMKKGSSENNSTIQKASGKSGEKKKESKKH